jgi:YgiT-type zinc finger domain-containing protein
MICKQGDTQDGKITIVLERGSFSWKAEGVSALVCDYCGESFVDEVITAQILAQAEESIRVDTEKDLYPLLVN